MNERQVVPAGRLRLDEAHPSGGQPGHAIANELVLPSWENMQPDIDVIPG
jgi:hypothetical protein